MNGLVPVTGGSVTVDGTEVVGVAATGSRVLLTLAVLAERLGGLVEGDGGRMISGVASLGEAGPSDITFLVSPRYRESLSSTKAGAVIAARGVDVAGRDSLRVENPYLAFARALEVPLDILEQTYADLGFQGSTRVPTPHLDKLAADAFGKIGQRIVDCIYREGFSGQTSGTKEHCQCGDCR